MSSRWYPPPASPHPVADGLRARSRRGPIAQTWWSERFIEVLESLGVGSRLQRGRAYARKGQVIDLTVAPGSVTAQVQGTRARPYRVRIGVGRPPGRQSAADYVLSKLKPSQVDEMRVDAAVAADAVELLVHEGLTATQNRFNG